MASDVSPVAMFCLNLVSSLQNFEAVDNWASFSSIYEIFLNTSSLWTKDLSLASDWVPLQHNQPYKLCYNLDMF